MSAGSFFENDDDKHFLLRRELLSSKRMPAPPEMKISLSKESLLSNHFLVQELVLRNGYVIVDLEKPLSVSEYKDLSTRLGEPLEEIDPETSQFHVAETVLDLQQQPETDGSPSLAPFSNNWLPLHSERSQQKIGNQPKYLMLMAVEGNYDCAPTLLVDMQKVTKQLSRSDLSILSHTHYNLKESGPFIREQDGRSVISFLDFQSRGFDWVCKAKISQEDVNAAIKNLLSAMYNKSSDPIGVDWVAGRLLVFDNTQMLHGRTQANQFSTRRLWRIRLLERTKSLFENLRHVKSGAKLSCWEESSCLTSDDKSQHSQTFEFVDAQLCSVFERAKDPSDPIELHNLWMGCLESSLNKSVVRPELSRNYLESKPVRKISKQEVLESAAYVRMVKEVSNTFFRDDLYGKLQSDENVLLSTGSLDETQYGLGPILKETISYALDRDWYGYSDSRGHENCREAVAAYESSRFENCHTYSRENIVITMGATQAVASLADHILNYGSLDARPSLISIPNYPPMVEALAKRHPIKLVPTEIVDGKTSISNLISSITSSTPIVFLQTVTNPTGTRVPEHELAELIQKVGTSTMIILDETHEWLGDQETISADRSRENVIRIRSLSKQWSAPGLKVGWILASDVFVRSFYEQASSSYGCPPSLTYTLIECLARFELWRRCNIREVGAAELKQFDADYGLRQEQLNSAYRHYDTSRMIKQRRLLNSRSIVAHYAESAGWNILPTSHSINSFMELSLYENSYQAFREILENCRVSMFPGFLNFIPGGDWMRVSYGGEERELTRGLSRVAELTKRAKN